MISRSLHQKLQAALEKQPLERGEFRRIEGMGSHYASLDAVHEGHQHLFSVEIGQQTIFIFKI